MATILVCEPHPEVRGLLTHVVRRLGHEAVFPGDNGAHPFGAVSADVLVMEPADPGALAAARNLRRRHEAVPIVCASIYPPSPETVRLEPVAYLVKPFPLRELERALSAAVACAGVPA